MRDFVSFGRAFQSLLCWIGRVNGLRRHGASMERRMFQSLLCWIGRVNSATPCCARWPARCFNPCCVGSVASTVVPRARGLRPGPVSILVVLDRSRQPGLRRGAAGRGLCFNPCCVGSVASTGRPGVDRTGLYTVSILVVLDRSRQRKTISLFSINMPLFQSLLCWIGRVNLGYNPVPERHHIRFQSL